MAKLQLRDYQRTILDKVISRFNSGESEVVLGAAPSSGKTEMAISLIQHYSSDKVLVLTHGTTVLKQQWDSRFKDHGVEASQQLDGARVVFGLPQGLTNKTAKNKVKVDLLIVDEAHEFYYAKDGMVQSIIKNTNPTKVLLLTGTPSKFIAKGHKPEIVAAHDIWKEGFLSDVYVGLVSTKAKFNRTAWLKETGELKSEESVKLAKTVDHDLGNLLEALLERLRERDITKTKTGLVPEAIKLRTWASIGGVLGKTMIAASCVPHAEAMQEHFKKAGIKSLISHNELDRDSRFIQEFKDDPSIKILIVVGRGILGFNMTELQNVVDMSGSRNIDRIYQLYARVMRKHEEVNLKYFFKLSADDHLEMGQDFYYTQAALNMMWHEFISKYNGKNLNEMKVVYRKPKKPTKRRKKKPDDQNTITTKPIYLEPIPMMEIFTHITSNLGNDNNEYAMARFGEIMKREFNITDSRRIVNITEEQLLYMLKTGEVHEGIYN